MNIFLKIENNETIIKSFDFDGQQEVPTATQQYNNNEILIKPSNLTIKSNIFEPEFKQTLNLVENGGNSVTVKYIKKFQMMTIVEPPCSIESFKCSNAANVNLTHFITDQNLDIPILHSIGQITQSKNISEPKILQQPNVKLSDTSIVNSINSFNQSNLDILNEKITNLENSCSQLENKIIIPKNFDYNVEKIANSISMLTKTLETQQKMVNIDQAKIEKLLKLDGKILDKIIKLSEEDQFTSKYQQHQMYQSTPNQTLNNCQENLPKIPPPPPINMSMSPIPIPPPPINMSMSPIPRPPPFGGSNIRVPPAPPIPIPRSNSVKSQIDGMGERATPEPVSMSNVFEQIKRGSFNLKHFDRKKKNVMECASNPIISRNRRSSSLPQRTQSLTLNSSPILELRDALSRRRSIILPSSSDDDILEDDDTWE